MSDWTQGYTTEIEYTYGYYSELNPQRIRLAFAYNGLAFPEIGTAAEATITTTSSPKPSKASLAGTSPSSSAASSPISATRS